MFYKLFMTADTGIFGPLSQILGFIMNAIYAFFENVLSIENVNIGLVVIIFTIFIYCCLLPLTYRQQKFSFMTRKMNPELIAIQKKYKNRRDQAAMIAMQEEQRALYDKYGVSMAGSCIQTFIQLPILWALFSVLRNIPAYVGNVKLIFSDLVTDVMSQGSDWTLKMQDLFQRAAVQNVSVDFLKEGLTESQLADNIIDVSYKLSENGWNIFRDIFPAISDTITSTQLHLQEINYFGVLNISDTPTNLIGSSWNVINGSSTSGGSWIILICALLIPICSLITQIINIRTMRISNTGGMAASQMRIMNMVMPLISFIFVFNVPVGLGLYWIVGAIFRSILQILLNHHFDKIDMDLIIEKNKEKAEEKRKKRKEKAAKYSDITAAANTNTRKTATDKARIDASRIGNSKESGKEKKYRSDSLASKANMVSEFNKKNNRKK